MESYEFLGQIGEGTYGMVIKARHRVTGQMVAIKKFKESDKDEQVRKTALREIRILKQLKHANIVTLHEVFRRKGKLYLVFEYVDGTVLELMDSKPSGLDKLELKKCVYQLLRSLDFIHSNSIVHRDIKPENLLISKNGVLKLCDFGFARALGRPGAKYTDYVATRWYRAPELLVGDEEYSTPVDVWAVGCLFGEMCNGEPLFPGKTDLDQLYQMVSCMGELTQRHQEIFRRNPLYEGTKLPTAKALQPLDARFQGLDRTALSMMEACLRYEPDERETVAGLLRHPYFNGFREWFEMEHKKDVELDRAAAAEAAARHVKNRSRRHHRGDGDRRHHRKKQRAGADAKAGKPSKFGGGGLGGGRHHHHHSYHHTSSHQHHNVPGKQGAAAKHKATAAAAELHATQSTLSSHHMPVLKQFEPPPSPGRRRVLPAAPLIPPGGSRAARPVSHQGLDLLRRGAAAERMLPVLGGGMQRLTALPTLAGDDADDFSRRLKTSYYPGPRHDEKKGSLWGRRDGGALPTVSYHHHPDVLRLGVDHKSSRRKEVKHNSKYLNPALSVYNASRQDLRKMPKHKHKHKGYRDYASFGVKFKKRF